MPSLPTDRVRQRQADRHRRPIDPWAVIALAIVLAAECLLLYLLLQRTRLGLTLRAVASNPESSRLVGINAGAMLMLGWALAAAIGALAGSLVAARSTGFDAGLDGRPCSSTRSRPRRSAGSTACSARSSAGLVVGIADALTTQYINALDGIELVVPSRAHRGRVAGQADWPVRPDNGGASMTDQVADAAPEAVEANPPARSGLARLDARTVVRIVVGIACASRRSLRRSSYSPDINHYLAQALYLSIAAMGLNLLTGFNGQVSIGHGAFFGVGAFTTAILMVDHGWNFEATIPVAALVAAAVGVAVGIPALRVRGLYLALVTLGMAVIFPRVATKFVKGSGGVALLRPDRIKFASLIDSLDRGPVGVLRVPRHRGDHVRARLEPRTESYRPGDDRGA